MTIISLMAYVGIPVASNRSRKRRDTRDRKIYLKYHTYTKQAENGNKPLPAAPKVVYVDLPDIDRSYSIIDTSLSFQWSPGWRPRQHAGSIRSKVCTRVINLAYEARFARASLNFYLLP